MHDLSAIQRDLVYIISGLDEPHGLAIKEELDAYYETDVNPGRLYPNLDALVDKGFVDKSQVDKRTNAYTLTPRAQREIDARDEWENGYVEATVDAGKS